jgi:hypothetical protein
MGNITPTIASASPREWGSREIRIAISFAGASSDGGQLPVSNRPAGIVGEV